MLGAAVGEIVAVDRGHDDVGEPELGDRVGDARRLGVVERVRQPGAHVAEGAGAGAGLAHDHEGRVLLLPALADVGAARLLADGGELVLAHDAVGVGEARRRAGRAHADPGRLLGRGLVGPVRLFRVARPFGPLGAPGAIDEDGHFSSCAGGSFAQARLLIMPQI